MYQTECLEVANQRAKSLKYFNFQIKVSNDENRSGAVTEDEIPKDNAKQVDLEANSSVDEVHFIFLAKTLITVTSM